MGNVQVAMLAGALYTPMIGMIRANAANAFGTLRFDWPEYLMEGGELGLYMFSTCAIATLLQHPASAVGHVISNSFFRRAIMGLAMGATVNPVRKIHLHGH